MESLKGSVEHKPSSRLLGDEEVESMIAQAEEEVAAKKKQKEQDDDE